MYYAEDFRGIARKALTNKWGVAIGTGFVAGLLGGTNSSYRMPDFQWRENSPVNLDFLYTGVGKILLFFLLGFASIALFYALFVFLVGGAVRLGYVRFNRNLIDGNNPQFSDIFSRFTYFWQGFLMQLLMGIFIFLWSLLLIIPGIIAAYSYAMTPYILEENPSMSVMEAIRRSKEMMDGNKWRLFCLQISFIGWALLSILTCGVGFLFLTPYMSAAECAFFYEISGKNGTPGYQVPPSGPQYPNDNQMNRPYPNNQIYQQPNYGQPNQQYQSYGQPNQQYPNNNQSFQDNSQTGKQENSNNTPTQQ